MTGQDEMKCGNRELPEARLTAGWLKVSQEDKRESDIRKRKNEHQISDQRDQRGSAKDQRQSK